MKYLKDESLHGFLIRQQYRGMGKFEPKGVIDSSGNWSAVPYIHEGAKNCFSSFEELFLLNVIGDYYFENVFLSNFDIIDYPSECCFYLDNLFVKNTNKFNNYIRKPITFCPECASEMIKNNGFFYFRTEWTNDCYCTVHNVQVEEIKSNSYIESVDCVKKLMKGIKVKGETVSHPYYDRTRRNVNSLILYPIQFTWCANHALKKFVSRILEIDFIIRSYYEGSDGKCNNLEWDGILNYFTENKNEIMKISPSVFIMFNEYRDYINDINYGCDIYMVTHGDHKKLSDLMIMPKNRNCIECSHDNCKVRSSSLTKLEAASYTDLLSFSSAFNYFSNNFHFEHLGCQLWSPIRITGNR